MNSFIPGKGHRELPALGRNHELVLIRCDHSVRRPFASTGRPRVPVGLVASVVFFFSLFNFMSG